MLAEDETHLNLLPWVRSTWIVKGSRQRVMPPGTNRRRTIFGAVDLDSGRFLYQVCRTAVSASSPASASSCWPPTVGAGGDGDLRQRHHPPLQDRPGMAGIPPAGAGAARARYSPHDNPVERIWGAVKAYLANSPTPTMAGRIRQAHAFFCQRSPAQLLATAAPRSSPWLPDRYGQNFREAA